MVRTSGRGRSGHTEKEIPWRGWSWKWRREWCVRCRWHGWPLILEQEERKRTVYSCGRCLAHSVCLITPEFNVNQQAWSSFKTRRKGGDQSSEEGGEVWRTFAVSETWAEKHEKTSGRCGGSDWGCHCEFIEVQLAPLRDLWKHTADLV